MKYSWLACEVASECFKPLAARMPGDYGRAMSQHATGGSIRVWTPLHVLLNNSDMCLNALLIVRALLHHKIVPINAFAELLDKHVSTFCLFSWHPGEEGIKYRCSVQKGSFGSTLWASVWGSIHFR